MEEKKGESENVKASSKEEMKPASELLKTAKIGDVILFQDKVRGIVIKGKEIPKEWMVLGKAIQLTHFTSGDKWGQIAVEYLKNMAKNVGKDKKKGKEKGARCCTIPPGAGCTV